MRPPALCLFYQKLEIVKAAKIEKSIKLTTVIKNKKL